MPYINYSVIFDNVNLTSVSGLTVLATDPYLPGKRQLSMSDLARTDKSKVNSAFFNKKTLVVKVGITRITRDLVEQSFDSLMALLQGLEKDLIVRQAGGNRRYIATYQDAVFRQEGGSYLELDLFFETSEHFGYDTALTQLLFASGRTLYNYTDSFTIAGSAAWQTPIIKITFTALSGGTNKDVIVKNPMTGQQVTVNRTWLAGDILIVDGQENTVTVNGLDVDFMGTIPQWSLGQGYLQTTDGLTTRTKTIYAYYFKRYI